MTHNEKLFKAAKTKREGGENYTKIARWLNENGFFDESNRKWNQSTLSGFMVKNGYRLKSAGRKKRTVRLKPASFQRSKNANLPTNENSDQAIIDIFTSNMLSSTKRQLAGKLLGFT